MTSDDLPTVLAYHRATKHHFQAFARSAGYLDWATQPQPFRRYEGAPRIDLAHSDLVPGPSYQAALLRDGVPEGVLDAAFIAQLFRDSLSLSAWKQLGSERWALRVNPSSGNLHPTEGYLICGPVHGLTDAPCVAHYAPREHALEIRAELPAALWDEIATQLPSGGILVGLSSILWREAWKYGERAYRYCQHDVGHALAAVTLAAAGLGWRTRLVDEIAGDDLTSLLGLAESQGEEQEYADCLLVVHPGHVGVVTPAWTLNLEAKLRELDWHGRPNRLSSSHRQWPLVHEVARVVSRGSAVIPGKATSQEADPSAAGYTPDLGGSTDSFGSTISLRSIIHQRRSAVAMDGKSHLAKEDFIQMLAGLQTGSDVCPLDVLPWAPSVHLFFFVHRVDDLAPGLYCLVRRPDQLPHLQRATRSEFIWQVPRGCPADLGFHLLQAGDLRGTARLLSCGQDIAADGCFSLAMVADFAGSLQCQTARFYSRLYWECGLIGQILYLQAEVAGLRGTGIGCYFDDPVHELLGLEDDAYQSLYHFTVGGPVTDPRITTLPPYPFDGTNTSKSGGQ